MDSKLPSLEVPKEEQSDRFFSRPRSASTKSTSSPGSSHRKGRSGSLLSKFHWLRSNDVSEKTQGRNQEKDHDKTQDQAGNKLQPKAEVKEPVEDNTFPSLPGTEPESPKLRNATIANVISNHNDGRKRKGSLRKAALLGTGKLRLDRRVSNPEPPKNSLSRAERRHTQKSPTKFAFEIPAASSSLETNTHEIPKRPLPEPVKQPNLNTSLDGAAANKSPLNSPTETYVSTTDDDEGITMTTSLNGALLPPPAKSASGSPSPPSSESSGPVQSSPVRRHTSVKGSSPLAASQISEYAELEQGWDYSETEWWGWVIFVVTWIVFVVGMGSCFEVWSWAWDVGQTPYAPPELEDDPTLPIVGYYPALIILTAVMSWVWVVVAWVGLKYFKHAKIQSEDT